MAVHALRSAANGLGHYGHCLPVGQCTSSLSGRSDGPLRLVHVLDARARPLDLGGLVEERVSAADGPLHFVRVHVVAVADHHGAALGDEVGRDPVLRELLGDEDRVRAPEDGVDLVDVLAVLHVLLDALEVAGDARAPPGVLGALALQVLADGVLVREAVALVPGVVDGAKARAGERAVEVGVEVLHEQLDQVPVAHGARDHERRHVVVVERRVDVHPRVEALAHGEDVAVDDGVLELPEVLRQGVAVVVVGEALGVLALLLRGVLKGPGREHRRAGRLRTRGAGGAGGRLGPSWS
mmetsp:Transcript_97506/g.303690  ORF Transcript_97506/g.303690 Transcript_97506/m.303690 type:complete len:296 (+) Transcript_97506:150-1037(+)